MKKNQRGFTLIELLVVIAIIGILASLTIANFNGAQARARDAQRKNSMKIIRDALEQRKIDNGSYPASGGSGPTKAQFDSLITTLNGASYVSFTSLADPRSGTSPYDYYYFSNGTTYTLRTCLENSNDTSGTWTNGSCGNTTGAAGSGSRTYTVVNP